MADIIYCARGCSWTGLGRAHCAACHYTFGSVYGFDRHRRGGGCLEPADVGMELRAGGGYAFWVNPYPDHAPRDSDGPTAAGQG